ncbi:MAG: hypothetical protein HON54_07980 [Verrucomicrobia bacterium]|nr:hypothetical protein [Verrucomicrobiota bacterium]
MLRDNGYKTFLAGKWHFGSKESWPTDHSYDINKGGWGVGSPCGVFFAVPESESQARPRGRVAADLAWPRIGLFLTGVSVLA